MRPDLIDLRLFCSIAEAGSITGGSARMNLALSAASTRIRTLEQMIGASLLERHHRGVTLTPAGKRLWYHARTMVAHAERMQEELGVYSGRAADHV